MVGVFATFAKVVCTAVAKCGAYLPLRNLQALDFSAIGETEALADALPMG
jgi:hypothetical protein